MDRSTPLTGPIAVTGATGNIGGAVVAELVAAGSPEVIAVVRDPDRLTTPDAVARVADYTEPVALRSALGGVATLVFIPSDGEAAPMLAHHANVIDAAVRAGVGHIVFLSMIDLEADSPFCYSPVYRETERMLRDGPVPHTLVRATIYSEFFADWITEAAGTGVLRLPMGSGRMSLISRTDVARSLAAVVRTGATGTHVITGDYAYDLTELAALAAEAAGVAVRADDIDPRDFCIVLLRRHVDPWWAYAFTTMFQSIAQHRFAAVTDTVAELTGRAPVPFADVARWAIPADA